MAMSPEVAKAVEAAFLDAQKRTRAPMVGVLAAASSDYALPPLLGSGLLTLLSPWPLLIFTRLSAERIFIAQLLVCLVSLAVLSLTPLRYVLTPRRARRAHAHRAALVQYSVRGLDRTPEGAGVLIYVSLAERYARIVADDAACRVVAPAQWQGVVDGLVADLQGLGAAAAMANAATRCAELLAPAFPSGADVPPSRRQHFHVV
jgi:putative membrane protein